MRPREYTVQEVFSNTSLGLKFSFFSSKKTEFIAEDLSKLLAKQVVITGDEKSIPSWSSAILLKEYNGKKPRYQLKLAQQDFLSLGSGMHGVLSWIKENAALDYSNTLSISLSFNHRNLQTLSSISNMDIGKMILKIDENFLYNKFPVMEKSPFSLSVKKLVPFDGFMNISSSLSTLATSFKMPMDESYAIDFREQTMGILKFNYIGGPEYAEKPHEVNETIKYYILSTYQVLNTSGFTPDMKYELDKINERYSVIRRCYNEPEFFLKEFANLKVSVDLKKGEQVIKTHWDRIRTPLLKLIAESDLKEGYFNWDSDLGRFELNKCKINGIRLNGFNLVNCEVNGVLENCHLWRTKLSNSRIRNSVIVSGNEIKTSLLEGCRADRSNTIERSYIINKGEIINCKVNESIIKNAGLGKEAKIDEECTVIEDRQKISPDPIQGIKSDEIRDYKWIKNMRKTEDLGFQNEFKIKY
jgi:hypothetical protein